MGVLVSGALVAGGLGAMLGQPATAAVGQGFNLNVSDVRFILQQIKIAEAHAAGGTLVGPGPNQVASPRLPFGLRSVDGRNNNLVVGQSEFGAADRAFPRLLAPSYQAPYGPSGNVTDPQPRLASNLIVDQTATNPSAVEAAGSDPQVDNGTLMIPNRAPDVGLSAPYNSWFTIFGQFFDHGLDLVGKGNEAVIIPLQSDDPLFVPNAPTNFMVLSRAAAGGSGSNSTSTFVDQSQTYTSHPSHQVFLREYAGAPGAALATGKLLTGADGGLATWAAVKAQARTQLGIVLADTDVLNVPLLLTDDYGRFVRGPNGYPQMVGPANALTEGSAAGTPVPANVVRTGHAFLDDLARHANPVGSSGPLTPDADPGTTNDGIASTYDDEMLDRHFTAGDGRVNENIALTAVHHVFHAEHNRVTGDINTIVASDPALQTDWNNAPNGTGERLFQAAKFVTEMEYQHLAFEEFARKVQPQVNLFGAYDTSIDPAITAEFAHVVYRFGHSMLTETVARRNANGTDNSLPLLTAFLDPTEYTRNGTNPAYTPEQAAGSIVRGMTRQVGNELDEFVTEALRNRLLGLPLDLATLNMARGRETGVPRLNAARAQFYAETNDTALQPYSSWADFQFAIKHSLSLVNFVAAYGTHPTITGTMADRRAAAQLLVNADPAVTATPADAGDFLNGTGAWNAANSGLNDVDFWVGGLAEKQQPFGGLLGNTFNFVFETQMEDLQDGDRFYYLSRTAGLNLLTQLEGNSFAELITRNTDATGLPADSFSRPDFILNMDQLGTSGAIPDDPTTEDVNEADRTTDPGQFLSRMPDGTVRYAGPAHVVFNGGAGPVPTGGINKMRSSEGDDTLRGNDFADRMEGEAGNDSHIGGLGDDIITDTFGDDVLKGGDGDDYMSSGQGFDLNQGGLGNDFVVGGSDPTETFGGPGNDMIIAGGSADTVFGDDGDDWIEGGNQNDLLQGDNGAPFQDDVNEAGHDVIRGDGGDDDFDSEGGDDIMVAGPGIERNEGMRGFDWTTHKGDPQAANSDMNFTGLLPDTLDTLRDRFDLTESLSGWNLDDTLRGDSRLAADMVGHELTAAGTARISGLQALIGATTFTGGNIVLGGAGSDVIEGRGGDDHIDGDAWLNVQLRAPDPASPGNFKLVDSMSQLQADIQAGRIDPGLVTIVRTAVPGSPGTNDFDTAVFTGPRAEYDFTPNADSMTVVHARGTAVDGTDTVNNVERLTFADGTVEIAVIPGNTPATGTVNISDTTPTVGQLLNAQQAIVDPDGFNAASIVYSWQAETAPNVFTTVATGATFTPAVAQQGQRLRVQASFLDGDGVNESVTSAPTAAVAGANVAPTVTVRGPAAGAVNVAVGSNVVATFSENVIGVNAARFTLRQGTLATGALVGRVVTPAATVPTTTATLNPNANLLPNTVYTVRLLAGITDTTGLALAPVQWSFTTAAAAATVPGAPVIGTAVQGAAAGAPINATANWNPPANNGGSAITGYRIRALRMSAAGAVLQTITSAVQPATSRSLTMTLPQTGNYRFTAQAINAVNPAGGAQSARSNLVAGR